MSLSPKGWKINCEEQEDLRYLKHQRLLLLKKERADRIIEKNKYPFNSSDGQKPINKEIKASVGLYELSNPYEWNKKSFNMYFH